MEVNMQISLWEFAFVLVIMFLLIFVVVFMGFLEGVRLGMRSVKGIEPNRIKNPVSAVINTIHEAKTTAEQNKADEAFREGFNAIFSYDGDSPKKEG